jgi:hypothetical protein
MSDAWSHASLSSAETEYTIKYGADMDYDGTIFLAKPLSSTARKQ